MLWLAHLLGIEPRIQQLSRHEFVVLLVACDVCGVEHIPVFAYCLNNGFSSVAYVIMEHSLGPGIECGIAIVR